MENRYLGIGVLFTNISTIQIVRTHVLGKCWVLAKCLLGGKHVMVLRLTLGVTMCYGKIYKTATYGTAAIAQPTPTRDL